MDLNLIVIASLYLIINTVAFFVMMADKIKSRKNNSDRISEGTLFFMSIIFGSVGVYLGMFVFHHKTRKWNFILGVPFLMLQNIVFLSVVYNFLNSLK